MQLTADVILQAILKESIRERAKRRISYLINKSGNPKLEMSVIVVIAGFVALVSSKILLNFGISAMWLRYPLAILMAYLCFIGLIYLWIKFYFTSRNSDAEDDVGYIDFSSFSNSGSSDNESFDGIDGFDADEGIIPFIIIVFLGLISFAGGIYIIVIAPSLLAELIVDIFMVSIIYRSLNKSSNLNWIGTLVKRTYIPLLILIFSFSFAGYFIQKYYPDVITIGDLLN